MFCINSFLAENKTSRTDRNRTNNITNKTLSFVTKWSPNSISVLYLNHTSFDKKLVPVIFITLVQSHVCMLGNVCCYIMCRCLQSPAANNTFYTIWTWTHCYCRYLRQWTTYLVDNFTALAWPNLAKQRNDQTLRHRRIEVTHVPM